MCCRKTGAAMSRAFAVCVRYITASVMILYWLFKGSLCYVPAILCLKNRIKYRLFEISSKNNDNLRVAKNFLYLIFITGGTQHAQDLPILTINDHGLFLYVNAVQILIQTVCVTGEARDTAVHKPQDDLRTGGQASSGDSLQGWVTEVHTGARAEQWWLGAGKEVWLISSNFPRSCTIMHLKVWQTRC